MKAADSSASPAGPDDRLGVWRLLRPLAEVPSGTWWRAVHSISPQQVLILVYGRSADAGAVLLRMAQAEGQPWTHPDIAWPLDSGLTADGRPYVVMPMLDGEPLMQAVHTASLRRRLDWVMQLCELLLLARSQGLSLVELDPSLLWVGLQQQLRLHALALVSSDAQAQRLGSLQGEVSLAAQGLQCPQTLAGTPGGAQAQVYSVGMLMCLLVNGRLPQDTMSSTGAGTVQLLQQWLSLSTSARSQLDALLHRAVHADPAQRPADLDQLAAALEGWLEQTGAAAGTAAGGLTAGATPAPAPVAAAALGAARLTSTSAPEPAEQAQDAQAQPTPASALRSVLPWALGGLLLAALLLAVWWTGRP